MGNYFVDPYAPIVTLVHFASLELIILSVDFPLASSKEGAGSFSNAILESIAFSRLEEFRSSYFHCRKYSEEEKEKKDDEKINKIQ